MSSAVFLTLPVPQLFWRCVLPGSVSMLFAAIYIVIDGMFVGHYMGSFALASISLMWPLLAVCFSFGDLVASGSCVQIGICLGRRLPLKAARVFTCCLITLLLLSLAAGLLCYFFTDDFLLMLGTDAPTTALGISYTFSYCVFMPAVMLFHSVNGYLWLCGRQRYAMHLNIAVSLINLLLDYIFIVALRQGVWAASFTTCAANACGMAAGFYPFLRGRLELKLTLGAVPPRLFCRMLYNGGSTFLTTNSWSVLQLCVNSTLLSLGGSLAVGATAAVMYISSVVNMLLFGMAEALKPALSCCTGAGLWERVWAIERRNLRAAGIFSVAAGLILMTLGSHIVPLYARDGDLEFIALTGSCMRIIACSFMFSWAGICLDVFLTALDSPGRSFAVSVCRNLLFPLVFLYLCAPVLGLYGVWLAPTLTALAGTLISAAAARSLWRERTSGRNPGA